MLLRHSCAAWDVDAASPNTGGEFTGKQLSNMSEVKRARAWSGCVLGGHGLCAFVSKGIRFGDEELPIDLRAVGSKLSTSSVARGTENTSFSGRGLWMQETGLRSHTSQQLL